MMSRATEIAAKAPPQPLPTRGRDLTALAVTPSLSRQTVSTRNLSYPSSYKDLKSSRKVLVGEAGAAGFPLPLVGRVVSVANREGSFLPHSNIDPKTRTRAKKLRTELTKAEARMWNMLRDFRPRGARFRRETPIGPYIADFAWLSARIVIEVDGDSHETSTGRKHDSQRNRFLQTQGFLILRFDNAQVIDGPDYVFLAIEQAISPFL
jgi:very-short-patch-repair endonuclease